MQTTVKFLIHNSIWFLLLTLTSCLNSKTVIRNYRFSDKEKCDCITKHPLIVIGTKSNYFSKEKSTCTRTNYFARRDSVYFLNDLKYKIQEELDYADSLNPQLVRIEMLLNDLKRDWTHSKIKTKWKGSADTLEVIILKQKIRYFNNFKPLRKYVGKEKYKNGKLIMSKIKNN